MLSDQLQRAKKVMSDRPRASELCYWPSEACCKLAYHSGRSRPSDKGEGAGSGLKKIFFGPSGLSLI